MSDFTYFDINTSPLSLYIIKSFIKTKPIEIYPNPSSSRELTIELDNYYDNVEVALYSISGQLISKQLYKNTRNINFEINQQSGLYVIKTKIRSNLNSCLIQIVE